MAALAYLHDIHDFGILDTPELPGYGTQLSHALLHDYFTYRQRSGTVDLDSHQDYVGYVSIVMESIEGFQQLTDQARNDLLFDGVSYLHQVRKTLERFLGYTPMQIDIYARIDTQRNVALVI